eukprot:TRINITY_DN7102_c0_g1_i10.p1 TRINITY_DN7102_c0_g1~~TRINITY_DN7102_c0_g1_i10.p1  ORF type:complete len:167 (-),score=40.19 TRINITY_DN7102_c0_g1_i10:479-979(-)
MSNDLSLSRKISADNSSSVTVQSPIPVKMSLFRLSDIPELNLLRKSSDITPMTFDISSPPPTISRFRSSFLSSSNESNGYSSSSGGDVLLDDDDCLHANSNHNNCAAADNWRSELIQMLGEANKMAFFRGPTRADNPLIHDKRFAKEVLKGSPEDYCGCFAGDDQL